MNIVDKKGKVVKAVNTTAKLRQTRVLELIKASTSDFITKKSNDLLTLQEIKNILKTVQGNPFNMHTAKGHANAQVRHDCLRLRAKGFLEAKAVGNRVVFYSPEAIRELVSGTKDKSQLQSINERYKTLQELPRKESYY